MRNEENARHTPKSPARTVERLAAGLLVAASLTLAACGSDMTEAIDTTSAEVTEVVEDTTEAVNEDADATNDAAAEGAPAEGERPDGPPPEGESGRPDGPPPEDGAAADEADDGDDSLSAGPQNVGEHGPFSNADLDRDETVTRAELDEFMDGALEREIGLVAFFDIYDEDADDVLGADELATVDPAFAFDGTDANEDGNVSLDEVVEYANEEGRSYRAIGLGEFFDLVDTDSNDEVSPAEIEVAHESGLLARF